MAEEPRQVQRRLAGEPVEVLGRVLQGRPHHDGKLQHRVHTAGAEWSGARPHHRRHNKGRPGVQEPRALQAPQELEFGVRAAL